MVEDNTTLKGRRLIDQRDKFLDFPNVVADLRFHRRRHAERLMHPAIVVVHLVDRNHMFVVLKLLAESIRQASEPARAHSHREI